jgi:hypothetical protein
LRAPPPPRGRFPHPPFKIPDHLPKPADPIANPPAAAAKQKAAAQAAAAALAAEQAGPKEMAIVTWLGHWQCDCGKVHKLWDSCKCGQAPPCREWVRGQCNISKCRFPHPPFAIPASLPKPDDPIANPTAEQLVWSKEHLAAGSGGSGVKPAANGRAGTASSGESTPVGGAAGGDAPANGADKPAAPAQPSAIMQPGVSFRQALLKQQQQQQEEAAAAAAAAAAAGTAPVYDERVASLPPAAPPPPPPPVAAPPPPPAAPAPSVLSPRSAASPVGGYDAAAMLSPRSVASAMGGMPQQNGLSASDPVTAPPLSARGDQQVSLGLGGGWNPLGGQGGSLLSVAPHGPAPQPPTPAALAPPAPVSAPAPTPAQQQAALAALGAPQQHLVASLASPTAAAAQQQQLQGGSGAAAQYTLQQALQQMALQQAAAAQAKAQQQAAAAAAQQQQQAAAAAAAQKPLRAIAHTLLEGGLMDPAFYHALGQVGPRCARCGRAPRSSLAPGPPPPLAALALPAQRPRLSLGLVHPSAPSPALLPALPSPQPRTAARAATFRSTSCLTGTTSRTASRWRTSSAAWSSSTQPWTRTSQVGARLTRQGRWWAGRAAAPSRCRGGSQPRPLPLPACCPPRLPCASLACVCLAAGFPLRSRRGPAQHAGDRVRGQDRAQRRPALLPVRGHLLQQSC